MRLICLLAALLLTACAAPQTRALLAAHNDLPLSVELTQVPFFPQTEHQCGPAALATVLSYRGVDVSPEALVPQVYLPGREGSLAVELVAASRRHDRIAWRIQPNLNAALALVAAGKPVLILQNRALDFAPLWHFAVLIGFDLDRREVVLRSGTMSREILSLDAFERTWARGDNWAVIVTSPDELPDFVALPEAMQQALALEKIAQPASSRQLYTRVVERWPQHDPARFGLANSAYAQGDGVTAEAEWRRLLDSPQPLLPAYHNLVQYLLEQQRRDEAKAILQRARQRWPTDPRLLTLEQMLSETGR